MSMSEEITAPRSIPPAVEHPGPERDLSELRREVIESRNLVIKTDNLLKNLHAELKQMGRKQELFEKRHMTTSVAAYFLFAALATLVAASSPLSCAEGLEAACSLKEDTLDVVHSFATAGEIGGTILAFGLLGLGFLRGGRRRYGIATFAFGAVWLALTIVTGVSYLSDGVDEIKGAFQRVDQILFGVWLVVLAVATGIRSGAEE